MTNHVKALSELFTEVCKSLTERIKSKDVTHQDLKNAIEFLKNNGITGEPLPGSPVQGLLDEMPFPSENMDTKN